jgi:hypothetical protein
MRLGCQQSVGQVIFQVFDQLLRHVRELRMLPSLNNNLNKRCCILDLWRALKSSQLFCARF